MSGQPPSAALPPVADGSADRDTTSLVAGAAQFLETACEEYMRTILNKVRSTSVGGACRWQRPVALAHSWFPPAPTHLCWLCPVVLWRGVLCFVLFCFVLVWFGWFFHPPPSFPASGEPGLTAAVRAWIKLKARSDQRRAASGGRGGVWAAWFRNSTPVVEDLPLWPQVYYCLRCGGRKEALELVQLAVERSDLPRFVLTAMQSVVAALDHARSGRLGAAAQVATSPEATAAIAQMNKRFDELDRVS